MSGVFLSGAAMAAAESSASAPANPPGCERASAQDCLGLAMTAMGGRSRLAAIHNVQLEAIGHTLLTEQSYRQEPFISSYERGVQTLDFANSRVVRNTHLVWPEADDPKSAEIDSTFIATLQGGVYHQKEGDIPASRADLDSVSDALSLSPERLLLTAAAAPDLHYEATVMLRSTPHAALAFQWHGLSVRILLKAYNHLPDAWESTRPFNDFWYAWGDVAQRVYLDNWVLVDGVVYPTNRIEERNGVLWKSLQVLDTHFNVAVDDKRFAMDADTAAKSAQGKGWERAFSDKNQLTLAPGVDLYQGAWNTTLIKQDDGVLVLEAPISGSYMQGILAQAHKSYAEAPIKAVISTSDSWPHTAGVREAVAAQLPVYVLDLNRPLLEKLVSSPHALRPDRLQTAPQAARWEVVSGKRVIGSGANRVELYPLRGAATERQYMVYFPAHKLLYASDTLSIDPQSHALYDPQLMHEVLQAVMREHLAVDTVYAMHQQPTPWREIVERLKASTKS
ncbi:MBL fold metallo-hydrolase [Dyella silvatica]|uniref:MBL fold metallo-hydrolase n=1 Tax=Dyella silvatica TaxID=2992128 RepID=UPI002255971F|nr:MBL fold metallo-hydrolase [Dyella silvatica]